MNDILIEKAVLGAFIAHAKSCGESIDTVRHDWFSLPYHSEICMNIQAMRRDNEFIDLITIYNKMGTRADAVYLAQLSAGISGINNVVYHTRILQQLWTQREVQKLASDVLADPDKDPFQTITEIKQRLNELELTQDYKLSELSELVKDRSDKLIERSKSEIKIVGKRSGSALLDRYIGGLVGGELIIVAGRPGMGKTSFAVSLGIEHCRFGGAVLMFSIEMPEGQIADRVISAETTINNMKIRNAQIDDYETSLLGQINLPEGFYLNDNSRLDIDNIGAIIKAAKAKYDLSLVIIDYMQLIRSESKNRNREQEVAYISSTCKRIAKDADVCVMALAQLSRDVEKRGGAKIPQLSDLRESGSIEQDADVVLFPFRPDYYSLQDPNFTPPEVEDAQVFISKCRNGMTGHIGVKFRPATTQYIF